MNSLRSPSRHGRRVPWPRLIVISVVIVVLYQLLSINRVRPKASSHANTNYVFDTDRDDGTGERHLYNDFSWYKEPHPRPQFRARNFTTADLSLTERLQLQERSVARARILARKVFEDVVGIPGSSITYTQAAQQLRSRIDCWTRGQWVKDPSAYHIKSHLQDPIYGSCDKRFHKTHSKDQLRPEVQYAWQPSCPMTTQVNPAQWCKALNGRNVMLAGDLVQYQLHEVLLDTFRDAPAMCYGELNCKDHQICSEPDAFLRYFRNDKLTTIRKFDRQGGNPSVDLVEMPFMAGNTLQAYQIYIINRGPVAEDDDTFINEMIQTMRRFRDAPQDILVIYRSTSIGHPYCDDATEPLPAHLSDSQLRRLPYGWSETSRRNAIAREIVEAAGGLFVDLGAMTDLRPDGHIGGQDCVRYCIPGPTDAWSQVLYNIFMEL